MRHDESLDKENEHSREYRISLFKQILKDRVFNDIWNVKNEFFFKYDSRNFKYKITDDIDHQEMQARQNY